ncbi:DNA phosphorothioation-dependent restriction protein DptG [Rossellomorea marisflavi]|uniref:DNA phosphorothioation-dependent restriction protein DptG n=1 Tax=Rossellomorea marisflavi TaxID=189381 RepID=UPI00203E8A61|nr:DNA phosphorothioation-dependent restriction protein DptG [Rossellomorea marisflavi]MCM2603458.1 DNA phosphorothioation-dependent restriction protein DptG [Rossellomorea marisflavi]
MGHLNVDGLKDHLIKKNKHDVGNVFDIVPFLTKRTAAIKGNFNKVLGEFVRYNSSVELDPSAYSEIDTFTTDHKNKYSEHIASQVEFQGDGDAEYDFIRFLDRYLASDDKIKPIHPHLFNYIPVEKKFENEFGKYAQFLSETLASNSESIKDIFKSKQSDNILTDLILNQLNGLRPTKEKKQQYQLLLKPLVQRYQEDVLFLSKHTDYFLASFPLLTHFYTLMYAMQLVFKFEQFTQADFNQVTPLYFALDWEPINKRRRAADEMEGYKFIKGNARKLFPHIHTISHLSHNDMQASEEKTFAFTPYSSLYQSILEQGDEYEKEFLADVKLWIKEYKNLPFTQVDIEDHSTTLPEAFNILFKCLEAGTSSIVADKFGKNIDDLASDHFIKSRGSIGNVLNIKHDLLHLMTAVAVKDKRIPLNDLFDEFEKRGIALDRHSKKEVMNVLDNLNIIDKKSDSGDAQYVKPIL